MPSVHGMKKSKNDMEKQAQHKEEETTTDFIRRKIDEEGQYRCQFCRRMFFIGHLGVGTEISPKCPRCGKINKFTVI